MKYIIALVFTLLLCGPAALAAADVLVPIEPEEVPAVNHYFIGVHRPDGSCETIEVFADSYDRARQMVKEQRCDICVLTDMTASMTSGDPGLIASATRFCPFR